ncbi:hypothetical protein DFA_11523 [Cavenderia fasciculata]|uniref:PH domain-containing protein n=1 Tax=Cavenderia fasciculata TaxID=261658 RepID=F4QDD4_CACFS|nr:uncharacterized protein DFA_11523 [Cavenderia fasciculata]EGG13762.1 hypothetical protein DFA_11523 [Cavenderia fasciculata]|eukprot:XP_004350470.1 hypothetical protein DFA_11523 [Cavenderia fasciculata]
MLEQFYKLKEKNSLNRDSSIKEPKTLVLSDGPFGKIQDLPFIPRYTVGGHGKLEESEENQGEETVAPDSPEPILFPDKNCVSPDFEEENSMGVQDQELTEKDKEEEEKSTTLKEIELYPRLGIEPSMVRMEAKVTKLARDLSFFGQEMYNERDLELKDGVLKWNWFGSIHLGSYCFVKPVEIGTPKLMVAHPQQTTGASKPRKRSEVPLEDLCLGQVERKSGLEIHVDPSRTSATDLMRGDDFRDSIPTEEIAYYLFYEDDATRDNWLKAINSVLPPLELNQQCYEELQETRDERRKVAKKKHLSLIRQGVDSISWKERDHQRRLICNRRKKEIMGNEGFHEVEHQKQQASDADGDRDDDHDMKKTRAHHQQFLFRYTCCIFLTFLCNVGCSCDVLSSIEFEKVLDYLYQPSPNSVDN